MDDCFTRNDCSIRVYQYVSYTSTEIHFLPVRESYIHALSRNTKCLTIDGQVCFTNGFLPMLLSHEDGFFGPEGHQ